MSLWQSASKKITRFAVLQPLFFLPEERRVAVERWLRGREQFQKLRQADAVVVSFGKSGRTRLRVMISRFYQVRHGLPERALMGFDNLHRKDPAIPRIFFTHDNYLKDYSPAGDTKRDYRGKKVVLLARHPADVAVSQYYQWRFRMKKGKKVLNDYPVHGEDLSAYEFVTQRRAGLDKVVEFLNGWAEEVAGNPDLLLVRYEELRADPAASLARVLDFVGTPGTDDEVKQAVEYASFENMRQLEQQRKFWLSGGRMVPKDRKNPQSFKVRRGKVGGFREDFDEKQIEQIEGIVRERLAPVYGYGRTPGEAGPEEGGA